ncbi:MAG: hypothetical protein NC337_07055 [Roseburia sp.]|nr:hypothetical protein [Roseburia sp.]
MDREQKQPILKPLCGMLLCGLLLSGCGQREGVPHGTAERMTGVSEELTAMSEKLSDTAKAETEKLQTLLNAEAVDEILEILVKDDGVRERIRYGIGLSKEDTVEIVLQKMEECTQIVLEEAPYGDPIYSLEDLRLLPNLKQLAIDIREWDDTVITDFTPVAQLQQLEQVYISYDKEAPIDLSFLGEMDSITELFLTQCTIEDISFLGEMPQLQRLSLYETPVEDLAVLEKLPELVELSLSGNKNARHIEAVGTLTKLEELGLQYCGIGDIGFLSGLKELRGLNLNGNHVTDLMPLSDLNKLERLGASENGIRDISMLAGLTKLYDLALDGNEIQDISVLSNLTRLNQAGLSDNRIEDLSPLAGKEALMYAAVFGNPLKSVAPVWEVPLMYCMSGGVVSEEDRDFIFDWLKEQYPEAEPEDFEYMDIVRGDLNGDGLQDVGFVVDSFDGDGADLTERIPENRCLVILLQQKDGSWREVENAPQVQDRSGGGVRGDPYRGMYIEEGYLLLRTAWGSSGGTSVRERYILRNGALSLVQTVSVSDYAYADGYDVQVRNEETDTWQRYALAMDGYRMVRADLADSEHPYHKAFPEMDLYDRSYYVHEHKQETRMSASQALDSLLSVMFDGEVREELPYAAWQKESCELLLGIALPDYYYVFPETARAEEDWAGDYVYYNGMTYDDGALCHIIRYVYYVQEEHRTYDDTTYLLNDVTGRITER